MERFVSRLNQPPDPREDFLATDNLIFLSQKLEAFDAATGLGRLNWARHRRKPRVAFGHMTWPLEKDTSWEFPAGVYPEPKSLPFSLTFVNERTLRLRVRTREGAFQADAESLMLAGSVASGSAWKALKAEKGTLAWASPAGQLTMTLEPWSLELKDSSGKVLLHTHTLPDGRCMIAGRPQPFGFVRREEDLGQSVAASFKLFPDEKLFGCGESFTRLDKRGQSVQISVQDSHGTQTDEMYKAVPFYLSSRGYGVFVHGSTPMVFDLGHSYQEAQVLYSGGEELDLFLFIGDPKQVLSDYTSITGRSPLPPLWSFGLWMSRITYSSEEETRGVSENLTKHRIPCDVIHLDTGWFETDWCCDYKFSPTRFKDPAKMISDLKAKGHHICLWQLPYFTPKNPLYAEILEKGYFVKSPFGELPREELVLDFSNPATVSWYQAKLEGLFKLGVAAFKIDFGEAAPWHGLYHSGKSGHSEHNLYPLRYNKAAAELSTKVTGDHLIWARSAWAGSQRYPLHWGGDAEATDGGMLGTLRGGLSFGLSGFSFWSHDVGGFFPATPRELYLRWLPFGALSSHLRCHGLPPTEPWEFDKAFEDQFRLTIEFRYRLMPYLWAQAAASAKAGHPVLRSLFFEFPDDAGSWNVEDEFMLGSDVLVAPLFEELKERDVYLPRGEWVDLQSGKAYAGATHHRIAIGAIPAIILGRVGAAIPTTAPALHTGALDFKTIEWWLPGAAGKASGLYCAPDQAEPAEFVFSAGALEKDPLNGKLKSRVKKL